MNTIYWVIFIIVGVAIYFLSAYLRYLYRVNQARKKGKIIPKEKLHEIFLYYLCCYTSECPDKYEGEKNISSVYYEGKAPRSEKRLSDLSPETSETAFDKDELITVEEAKKRISQLIPDANFVSVSWISSVTLIPIDTVYDLISQEEFYRLEGDKVIRKKLIVGFCPGCDSPYSTYADFCPNCGERLTKKSID